MKMIEGRRHRGPGLCGPGACTAASAKNKSKPDLAMIVSDRPCAAAAVYTQNLVKGAPILVTQKNIADGFAQGGDLQLRQRQHLQRRRLGKGGEDV